MENVVKDRIGLEPGAKSQFQPNRVIDHMTIPPRRVGQRVPLIFHGAKCPPITIRDARNNARQ